MKAVRGTPADVATWLTARPFAHRGLYDPAAGIPENSMAAFQRAIDAGYGIELDIRVSLDGVAMVFHDATLDRMTDISGPVLEWPSYRLRQTRLQDSDETIPTLHDVLDLVDCRVPILIEVKSDRAHRHRIISSVRRALEGYRTDIGVMSFDPEIPRWFAKHKGPWAPGLVLSRHARSLLGRIANSRFGRERLMQRSKAAFLAKDIRDLPCPFIAAKRRQGYTVLSWTVRSAEDRERAQHHADNIIFETIHEPE